MIVKAWNTLVELVSDDQKVRVVTKAYPMGNGITLWDTSYQENTANPAYTNTYDMGTCGTELEAKRSAYASALAYMESYESAPVFGFLVKKDGELFRLVITRNGTGITDRLVNTYEQAVKYGEDMTARYNRFRSLTG